MSSEPELPGQFFKSFKPFQRSNKRLGEIAAKMLHGKTILANGDELWLSLMLEDRSVGFVVRVEQMVVADREKKDLDNKPL